jgi:hypothetical protein
MLGRHSCGYGWLWFLALAGCPAAHNAPGGGSAGGGASSGSGQGGSGAPCVQTQLCVSGSHWDSARCMCVSGAGATGGAGQAGGTDAGSGSAHCLQNQLCVRGSAGDSARCLCVNASSAGGGAGQAGGGAGQAGGIAGQAGGTAGSGGTHCVQNQLCVMGSQWDSALCKCVPGGGAAGSAADAGTVTGAVCTTAADCHGVLPNICAACARLPDAGLDAGPINSCAHWSCKQGHCQTSICD